VNAAPAAESVGTGRFLGAARNPRHRVLQLARRCRGFAEPARQLLRRLVDPLHDRFRAAGVRAPRPCRRRARARFGNRFGRGDRALAHADRGFLD